MSSANKNEITKNQIISDLKNLGVKKGDHIAVALSFKSIGYVVGGPDAFIDALLAVVGSEGTIIMNTFTLSFGLGVIPSDYIFDSKKTMPYTGLVPRTLIMRKDSIRSLHPTCSVASIGKMAKYLTAGHDETANPFLPYERLAKIDGKYLAVGIGNRLVGIRHEAQRRAGLCVVPLYGGVKFKSAKGKTRLFVGLGFPCTKKLPELVPVLDKMGITKRGKIGLADSIIGSADRLIDAMTVILKENPTLNLCDDMLCYKCRELEKKLNLYDRIANPKLFQRNTFIRTVLNWRNQFFIRRSNYIDWRKTPSWLRQILQILSLFRQFVFRSNVD